MELGESLAELGESLEELDLLVDDTYTGCVGKNLTLLKMLVKQSQNWESGHFYSYF